jgi:hypothetical protein
MFLHNSGALRAAGNFPLFEICIGTLHLPL